MRKRQRIVIDITYGETKGIAEPARWDWPAMLDLGPNETAAIVACSPVTEEDITPRITLADARMLTGRKPQ